MPPHFSASRGRTVRRGALVSRTAGNGSGKIPTATSRSRARPFASFRPPTPSDMPTTAMAGSSSGWKTGSSQGRGTDPAPGLASELRVRKDDIELEQTSLAAPLDGQIMNGPIVGDRDLVCLVRFRLQNVGARRQTARLHLEYSSNSAPLAEPLWTRSAERDNQRLAGAELPARAAVDRGRADPRHLAQPARCFGPEWKHR